MLFFLTAIAAIILDQVTKLWVSSILTLNQSIPKDGFFSLLLVHNTGAAFGLFRGQTLMLTFTALLGVAIILIYFFLLQPRLTAHNNVSIFALGLVLGGTTGNLIDRIRLHYVIDFLHVGPWPNFNLADSSVVVGMILFAYSLFRLTQAVKPAND